MAAYRIVYTEQEPLSQPTTRAHIVAVWTGTPTLPDQRWPLAVVLKAMDEGHTFYTVGGGKRAAVETYLCSHCLQRFIRSAQTQYRATIWTT